jgi:hypothetical protein
MFYPYLGILTFTSVAAVYGAGRMAFVGFPQCRPEIKSRRVDMRLDGC